MLTLYNPAHLARKLRALGFEVELVGKGQLKVKKVMKDIVLGMDGMDYFLSTIQQNLITEDAIVDLFANFIGRAESGTLPMNARIKLEIQHIF